jgi:hypothetical protein
LFDELLTYYISPEIYTKEVHELAEKEEIWIIIGKNT